MGLRFSNWKNNSIALVICPNIKTLFGAKPFRTTIKSAFFYSAERHIPCDAIDPNYLVPTTIIGELIPWSWHDEYCDSCYNYDYHDCDEHLGIVLADRLETIQNVTLHQELEYR